MKMTDREGLIARIRHVRRVASAAEKPRQASNVRSELDEIRALQARVGHLERLVEGLQDSVHRESERRGKLIADLEAQIQPAAMGAALNKDARDRGL